MIRLTTAICGLRLGINMKKKYFIFLGKAGLIYYSWLFIILFISLIFGYEGTAKINWPMIIIGSLFVILFIYTLLNSYWNQNYLKLSYRFKIKINSKPTLVKKYWLFKIYQIKPVDYQKYYLLRIEK